MHFAARVRRSRVVRLSFIFTFLYAGSNIHNESEQFFLFINLSVENFALTSNPTNANRIQSLRFWLPANGPTATDTLTRERSMQGFPKLVVQNWGVITLKVEYLQYYCTCHKMRYIFKCGLQILTGAKCGFLLSHGRCPSVRNFVPNPMNNVGNHFWYPCP